MENKLGIKETKEAFAASLAVGTLIYNKLKDGAQMSDVMEVIAKFQLDPVFKKTVTEGYEGANQVPAELQNLTLSEGIELSIYVMQEGMKAITALKV
jgi:hypothetical protein